MIHLAPNAVYFNALLATLNQREALHEKLGRPGLSQTLEFMSDADHAQNTGAVSDITSLDDSVYSYYPCLSSPFS